MDSTAWAFDGLALPYRYEPDPAAWARLAADIDGLMRSRKASP